MSGRLRDTAQMDVHQPIEERIRRNHRFGFHAEASDLTNRDAALAKAGPTFSSTTGDVTGTLTDVGNADELLRTAEQSLRTADGSAT